MFRVHRLKSYHGHRSMRTRLSKDQQTIWLLTRDSNHTIMSSTHISQLYWYPHIRFVRIHHMCSYAWVWFKCGSVIGFRNYRVNMPLYRYKPKTAYSVCRIIIINTKHPVWQAIGWRLIWMACSRNKNDLTR